MGLVGSNWCQIWPIANGRYMVYISFRHSAELSAEPITNHLHDLMQLLFKSSEWCPDCRESSEWSYLHTEVSLAGANPPACMPDNLREERPAEDMLWAVSCCIVITCQHQPDHRWHYNRAYKRILETMRRSHLSLAAIIWLLPGATPGRKARSRWPSK